ncbi:heparinase II/III family protein [Paenibacillus spongiae]|uniref:Heparinase II/III family protein n=1 Tax=Paenibacillus spongiae TaxID=2909671 RepID=A0ABY5SJW6_9BACL|nr:heparinase II/III family protein [Paenibacillus spongiae]UVI32805.1 heparinase II/III family protein [Paenibacillus spongiae]
MNVTMRLVEDWQAVREKIKSHSWAEQIVNQIKPQTDWWAAHYEDDPARVAGWGHHYFCDKCFASLIFDPEKPNEHRCSGCGQLREAQEADDAWCYIYRSTVGSQVFHAAVLYNIYEDPAYLAFIRKVLAFYCDHYGTFQVRTPPGQEGMFSGTDLTDAVTVIAMLKGLELVKEELTGEELETYKHRFFLPEAAFLIEKVGCTPNIICWMKAAAGMIGLFFNERIWCERAAEGEYGIKKKLSDGLLPEGFWYEASFHYHFYCADGLTYYLAFCKLYGYDFPEMEDALLRMYRYPVRYAFPNGEFPNPNDGWPLLSFDNYAHQYEWIRQIQDEAPFRYALAHCYRTSAADGKTANIGGIDRLLFGREWGGVKLAEGHLDRYLPDGKSTFDPDIYFGLLQSGEASVFLKYGFVLRGHSHADIMNIEIFLQDEVISRDISNSGYGSDLFREWQRKTVAHNSVMVDKQTQPNRPTGQMVAFDQEQNSCFASAKDVYPGIDFARRLQLFPDRLEDEFEVQASGDDQDEHVIDWLFHCSGEVESKLAFAKSAQPGDADGYQLMLDVSRCDTDEDWEVSWRLPDKTLTLHMAGSPGTSVYLFRGYEHRLDRTRWGVLVRRTGRSTSFNAVHRFAVSQNH